MVVFGEKIPGKNYIERPGAYAVILKDGLYAVVKNPKSYFLVGGGIENDETPEQALHREVEEEIGMTVRIDRKIGVAKQYFYVPEADVYLCKEGHFYKATLLDLVNENSEKNHELQWLTKEQAMKKMFHQSHRWAIEQSESYQ